MTKAPPTAVLTTTRTANANAHIWADNNDDAGGGGLGVVRRFHTGEDRTLPSSTPWPGQL